MHSPATVRNREPILAVLKRHLPETGTVLELAAGSGEHAAFFAAAFPQLAWQPSDPDAAALASIEAHRQATSVPNLRTPLQIDVTAADWPVTVADAILAINMLQVAPRAALGGLMRGAARTLTQGGVLYLYGPYLDGAETADSNIGFDTSLRLRNPGWGLYDWRDVEAAANADGLTLVDRVAMPADNFSLVFRRAADLDADLGADLDNRRDLE
nr:DUF938 domain-containing protein [Variibacter gotjawalensis]